MEKKDNDVEPVGSECGIEDTESFQEEYTDRIVVLKREPLPRKLKLMDAGVRDIRCIWCVRIKPIATAEDLGDGWVCEDCLSDMEDPRRYGGQRGK
jgi:hypothetical protein